MEPFFETQCHKCGIVDEAKFSYAGPHLKQICCECGAYIKFFDKKLIPDVQEIKLKIWGITGGDLERINEAKKKIEFVDNLTGLYQKIMYWRLYLHIRKQPKTINHVRPTEPTGNYQPASSDNERPQSTGR